MNSSPKSALQDLGEVPEGRRGSKFKLPFGCFIAIAIPIMLGSISLCISTVISITKPTPAPTLDLNAISTQGMQTVLASLPTATTTFTPLPTATLLPTETPPPTFTSTPLPTYTPIILPTATTFISILPTQPQRSGGIACCKHCTNSQPCGDSCISLSKTCRQPPGCACP